MQKQSYKGELVENRNNRDELAVAWENFCLQVIITALEDDPAYINTSDCGIWLDRAGVDNHDTLKVKSKTSGTSTNGWRTKKWSRQQFTWTTFLA